MADGLKCLECGERQPHSLRYGFRQDCPEYSPTTGVLGGRIQLEAVGLEFEENGNTIWVHGAHGTLLRIKCSGQIRVKSCEAPGAHADAIVSGDIEFCVPPGTRAPAAPAVGRRVRSVPAVQTVVRGTGPTAVGRGSRSGGRGRP